MLKEIEEKDLFRIGVVTDAHGVRGEIKVFPTTEEPKRVGKIKEIFLSDDKELKTVHPEKVRFQNNLLIIKFKEINDRDEALKIKKNELYVTRDNAVSLGENEYYFSDLIGLKCVDENDNEIGILNEIYETGANDVYEIKKNNGDTVLIPAIKQCVLCVDIEGGKMTVKIMEGLE